MYQFLSPKSKNLFHGAIAQSGVATSPFLQLDKNPVYYTRWQQFWFILTHAKKKFRSLTKNWIKIKNTLVNVYWFFCIPEKMSNQTINNPRALTRTVLRPVYTSGFHMRFLHCVAIFDNLPWLSKTKVSYKKLQRNAVNKFGNRMCKLSFSKLLLIFISLNLLFSYIIFKFDWRFLSKNIFMKWVSHF